MADTVDRVSSFRAMLHERRLSVAQAEAKGMREPKKCHLVGEDQRALCGTRRPRGAVYDMTPYATPNLCCARCIRITEWTFDDGFTLAMRAQHSTEEK